MSETINNSVHHFSRPYNRLLTVSLFWMLTLFPTQYIYAQKVSTSDKLTSALYAEPEHRKYLENFDYPEESRIRFPDQDGQYHHITFLDGVLFFDDKEYKLVSDEAPGLSLRITKIESSHDGWILTIDVIALFATVKTVEKRISYGDLNKLIGQFLRGDTIVANGE